MTEIFVFGSNLAGIHGAGSARHAYEHYGAQWGVGIGPTGQAYAIPTKDKTVKHTLPLTEVEFYVKVFIEYAKTHPELTFIVVKIGCGLAGFSEEQIAPLFKDSPENCKLPEGWRSL